MKQTIIIKKPIIDIWNEITEKGKATCRNCGYELLYFNHDSYDHDGGLWIEGFVNKQWLYFTCSSCGYQNSFAKLLR